MSITPNRQALKDLASFSIDSQFVQQTGGQFFNYSGEISPQYEGLGKSLVSAIDDAVDDLQKIKQRISV